MRYKVLQAYTTTDLEKQVQSQLEDGWILYGPMVASPSTLYQPMTIGDYVEPRSPHN